MKKYSVIGNPLEHSLSPKIHNYWFRENKINAIYNKETLDKDLENFIKKIKIRKSTVRMLLFLLKKKNN